MKTRNIFREIDNNKWREFMQWARENRIPVATQFTYCNKRYSTGTLRFSCEEGEMFWHYPSPYEDCMDEVWGNLVFTVRESDYPLVALRIPASQD